MSVAALQMYTVCVYRPTSLVTFSTETCCELLHRLVASEDADVATALLRPIALCSGHHTVQQVLSLRFLASSHQYEAESDSCQLVDVLSA